MELDKLFKDWTDEDFASWFFANLQRQSEGNSLYPNQMFINRVVSNNQSVMEIWRDEQGKMELMYKKEKLWKSS
jgi:hypothetical protein